MAVKPYAITEALRRFSQRNTAFARSRWDPSCAAYGVEEKSSEPHATRRSGYSPADAALQTGAWAVARSDMGASSAPPADSGFMDASEDTAPFASGDLQGFTDRVKQAARLYGADLVGVTRVDPLWVYASDAQEQPIELPDGVDTAVVMAVTMDYERICASPSMVAGAATGNGYSRMAFVTACLARYLTELGWQTIPSGNDTGLSVPLAIDAGLGQAGRNGLLITRLHGPRVRLCKVFTDAPLAPDTPVSFGVEEFCDVCMKCADTCPSRSISREEMTTDGPTPSNNPGARKWYVNPDTCLAFWRHNGTSCSNCIRSCPFNKEPGWFHDLARALIRLRSGWLDRLLVFLDDLCGYGTNRAARKAVQKLAANGEISRKKQADAVDATSA